jgi:hypothetical protein
MSSLTVYTSEGKTSLTREKKKALVPDKFDLFVDLSDRICSERKKGKINLLSKRVLGKLLCFLIIRSPKKYSAPELYENIWGITDDCFTAETSVKTAISRLRKIIEPEQGNWKYICKTEPSFWDGKRGQYYFDRSSSFCLILPESLALFMDDSNPD